MQNHLCHPDLWLYSNLIPIPIEEKQLAKKISRNETQQVDPLSSLDADKVAKIRELTKED